MRREPLLVGKHVEGARLRSRIACAAASHAAIIFEKGDRLGGKIRTSYEGSQANDESTRPTSDMLAVRAGGSGEGDAGDGEFVLGRGGVVPQELGACYTSPDYTRVGALLEEVGLEDQLWTVPPRDVHSAATAPGIPLSQYTLAHSLHMYPLLVPEQVPVRYAPVGQEVCVQRLHPPPPFREYSQSSQAACAGQPPPAAGLRVLPIHRLSTVYYY